MKRVVVIGDRACVWLQRRASRVIALPLFVGLVFQDLAAALAPAVLPLAVVTMGAAMVRVDWALVLAHLRRPLLALAIGAATMVAAPLLLALVLRLAGVGDDGLAQAVLLLASAPPITSSPAYALILGLDAALALVVALPWTLAAPFVMPPMVLDLVGLDVALGFEAFTLRLALMVGIAFAGAMAVRGAFGHARIQRHSHLPDAVFVISMSLFGIGVMDGIRAIVLEEPARVLAFVGAAFALNLGLQALAALVAWPLGRRRALTVGLLAGNRNAILVLGAVAGTAGPDVVLFVIAAQLPLYVMPLVLEPIVRRVLPDAHGAMMGRTASEPRGRKKEP